MGGRKSAERAGGRRPRRLRRLVRRLALLAAALVAIAVAGFWAAVLWTENSLPDVFRFEDYRRTALRTTRILAADGSVIAELFEERRTVVDVRHLPTHVVDAVVAAEDASFREHPGIDLLGIARALWVNLRHGELRQGGSTITQQVAKTFFLSPERTLARKLKELVLARKLEQRLTKNEILGLYLNQIYFGHGRYGIEEAARYFFGRSARDLSIEQAALLAGLIRSPERLSPRRHPARARARREQILRRMAACGFLDSADVGELARSPLGLVADLGGESIGAAHFVAAVRRELDRRFGEERVRTGGLTVRTTLDPRVQRAAVEAVRRGLRRIDRRHRFDRPRRRVGRAGLSAEKERVRQENRAAIHAPGASLEAVILGVEPAAGRYRISIGHADGCLPFSEDARYRATSDAAKGGRYRVGDVLVVTARLPAAATPPGECWPFNLEMGPQAALVAVDRRTRHVLALVGGSDDTHRAFDRVTQAWRQAGSTFKPIVYAAALESGAVGPETRFPNVALSYRGSGGRGWTPENFDGVHDGAQVTLAEALARSLNVVAVQVLREVGLGPTIALARRLGLSRALPHDLTIALGSASVNPLELTNAYATLTDRGVHREPVFVTQVLDDRGEILYRATPTGGEPVLSPAVADRIRAMLVAAVEGGTGRAARVPGVEVAGKTGTASDGVDAWFVGSAGPLTAGVWVGFDDRRPVGGTGGSAAAPLWSAFVRTALGRTGATASATPSGTRGD